MCVNVVVVGVGREVEEERREGGGRPDRLGGRYVVAVPHPVPARGSQRPKVRIFLHTHESGPRCT